MCPNRHEKPGKKTLFYGRDRPLFSLLLIFLTKNCERSKQEKNHGFTLFSGNFGNKIIKKRADRPIAFWNLFARRTVFFLGLKPTRTWIYIFVPLIRENFVDVYILK